MKKNVCCKICRMANTNSDAAAFRKRRAAILKNRREAGKVKPVMSSATKKARAEVAKLKADKLAMRKDLQMQKKKMADEIKAGKKKISDEKKRNEKLEKELRGKKARKKKVDGEKKKKSFCKDTELGVLHRKMILAVPSVQRMKNFTSKDHSEHREAMNSIWAALRKYLSVCNKTQFESSKRKKIKKAPPARANAFGEGGGFKNRPLSELLPDIGKKIDEAHYKKVTRQLFGSSGSGDPKKKKKKKKRIAPTFVGPSPKKKKRIAPTLVGRI